MSLLGELAHQILQDYQLYSYLALHWILKQMLFPASSCHTFFSLSKREGDPPSFLLIGGNGPRSVEPSCCYTLNQLWAYHQNESRSVKQFLSRILDNFSNVESDSSMLNHICTSWNFIRCQMFFWNITRHLIRVILEFIVWHDPPIYIVK